MDWVEATFYPDPPDDTVIATFARQYNTVLCVQHTVAANGDPIETPIVGTKWVVTDKPLQKVVMGAYEQKVCEKEMQWNHCVEHKKLLIDAVWGQLDDNTQAEMELFAKYQDNRDNGNIIVEFLKSLRDICNGSDDGGLSYHPLKVIVALKSLNLYSSQDVTNVHYYKKELKVKYEATNAICGKFPFGTEALVYVMVNFNSAGGVAANDFAAYCTMSDVNKAKWERIYDDLMLSMLLLNNLRYEEAKKELRHFYANGNENAY